VMPVKQVNVMLPTHAARQQAATECRQTMQFSSGLHVSPPCKVTTDGWLRLRFRKVDMGIFCSGLQHERHPQPELQI
jgi:hypothetical protein